MAIRLTIGFRPTTAAELGPAIQSGEIDVMSRNTPWTSSRDASRDNFAQTTLYDGQGFMAPRSLGISGIMEVRDASI